ncbi:YoaK family protein [soil metagenome]
MNQSTRSNIVAALLAFNGGFVDTAGFLGLNGLFTAHVTGNFVTLGHALVEGSHGIVGKILALPEFIAVIALARLAGIALRAHKLPDRPILLTVKVLLLAAFFGLAVGFGPFPDANTPMALLTGFAGIAAMAMQNAVQRVHMANMPPSTMMTGSTVQATIDAVDLLTGTTRELTAPVRFRFSRLALTIVSFATGCAASAVLYVHVGFWGLAVAVVVGTLAAVIPVEETRAA